MKYIYTQLFIILISLLCCVTLPMEHAVDENHFAKFPIDVLRTILTRTHQYPLEKFINARQLGYTCKQWYAAVSDNDTLAQACNIPPMHCAAMMNDATKIIELKLAGHSPLAPDAQHLSPAYYAIRFRRSDAAIMLKIGCADTFNTVMSPLDNEKAKAFLQSFKKPADVSCTQEDLTNAVLNNDYEKTVLILSNDLALLKNVHEILILQTESFKFDKLNKLLRYAVQCALEFVLFCKIDKKEDIAPGFFIFFAKYKANPNAYNAAGRTFLHCIALHEGLDQTLQQVLQLEGLDIDKTDFLKGLTPLQRAVCSGRVECMDFLIKKGADINCITAKKETLLHLAASNDESACLVFLIPLLRHHINSKNNKGYSPLVESIANQYYKCAKLLIQENADVTIADNHNQTALHFAASNNMPKTITLLMQRGADINSTTHADFVINEVDYGLYTPLHCAAYFGNMKALNALLAHGADQTLKIHTGKTALELLVQHSMKGRDKF